MIHLHKDRTECHRVSSNGASSWRKSGGNPGKDYRIELGSLTGGQEDAVDFACDYRACETGDEVWSARIDRSGLNVEKRWAKKEGWWPAGRPLECETQRTSLRQGGDHRWPISPRELQDTTDEDASDGWSLIFFRLLVSRNHCQSGNNASGNPQK